MSMNKSEAEWREKGKKQSDELWEKIKSERDKKWNSSISQITNGKEIRK